jgi:hypothetical protein
MWMYKIYDNKELLEQCEYVKYIQFSLTRLAQQQRIWLKKKLTKMIW